MMQLLNITCSGPYEVRYKYESEIKSKTESNTNSKLFLPLHPHSYLNLLNLTVIQGSNNAFTN